MLDDNRRAVGFPPVRIQGEPEEIAVIMAALEMLSEEKPQDTSSLKRSRWRLAGLLGHTVEPCIDLDGSLWSRFRWEG
jgi:hypothetical protein